MIRSENFASSSTGVSTRLLNTITSETAATSARPAASANAPFAPPGIAPPSVAAECEPA
jgi:hypothetical protein